MVAREVERFAQATQQRVAGCTRPHPWSLLCAPRPVHLPCHELGAGSRAVPSMDLSENHCAFRGLGRWA